MAERFAAKNLGEQTSFDFDFMQERASACHCRFGVHEAIYVLAYIYELVKLGGDSARRPQ
jgi:hypothetical protein